MFIQHLGIYAAVWEMCGHSDDCFYDHIYGAVQVFQDRCRTVTDKVYFLLFLTVILIYDCHQPEPQLVIDAGTTLWLC